MTNISSDHGYPDLSNWHQQISNEAAAVGLAMKVAGSILSLQPGQLTADATTLAALDTQALGTAGRQQSLQTLAGTASGAGQALQKLQSATTANQQALMTWAAAQQDRQYLIHSLGDHDMEVTWIGECNAIAALGGALPANCAATQ